MEKNNGAGKSHPLHPALVHFPITLFPLSTVFLVLWIWLDNSFYLHAAYWSFMFGALLILPVMGTGVWDLMRTISIGHVNEKWVYLHMMVGLLITFVSVLSGLYYLFNKPMLNLDMIPGFIGISILTTLLVLAQGFIGGVLVYTYRMGVSPLEDRPLP